VASVTGSSSSPELAAALHRLRSTLARMRAELEVADSDGASPPVGRLLGDLRQALDLLGEVESAAFALVRVLVLDDDERLGELTARGLRRMGYEAESSTVIRALRPRELVVLDLGLAAGVDPAGRAVLKAARPVVVTGAADPASRALAAELDASDYLIKPVELEELAGAIKRRAGLG
jgi:CheY-like chemotaxis protein